MEEKIKTTFRRMAMQTLPAVKAKRPFQVSNMPQKIGPVYATYTGCFIVGPENLKKSRPKKLVESK